MKSISNGNMCTNPGGSAGFFHQSFMYLLGTRQWAPLASLPRGPPREPWGEGCRMCRLCCKHVVIRLQLLLQRGREWVHLVCQVDTNRNILQREHSKMGGKKTQLWESGHLCLLLSLSLLVVRRFFKWTREPWSLWSCRSQNQITKVPLWLICFVISLSLLYGSLAKDVTGWGAPVEGGERAKPHQPVPHILPPTPHSHLPRELWCSFSEPSMETLGQMNSISCLKFNNSDSIMTLIQTFGIFFQAFACLMKLLRVNISYMQGWICMIFTGSLNEYWSKIKMPPT